MQVNRKLWWDNRHNLNEKMLRALYETLVEDLDTLDRNSGDPKVIGFASDLSGRINELETILQKYS